MIVAGFGFRAQATVDSLLAALNQAASNHAIEALAAPADKVAGSFAQFATDRALRVHAVSSEDMQAATPATRSAQSLAHRGTGSVAEACALAAAGPGARLLVPRRISPDRLATFALAIGPDT
jgi:cobalt-precorrin 5A hydrolase